MITPSTELLWTRAKGGSYTAIDGNSVRWSIDQHPTPRSRQGKNPDWSEKWWLHRLAEDGTYPEHPDVHEDCQLVTERRLTALHRHPEVLRYASVLAAGWEHDAWRIQNGTPDGDVVMRRGDERPTLSALMGNPVMIHPQRLLNAELRAGRFEHRAYAAEQALRDAGLPIPGEGD